MDLTKDTSYALPISTKKYAEGAIKFQERRHANWRENYSLYRDKVQTNRLTQRQSVNVPLMKETIRTILANTDETPDLTFENLENDKQKEIFINAHWEQWMVDDNFEIKDIVDKKQEALYGVSVIKLNVYDGMVHSEVLEPYDWVCDRYADPSDIDGTASYMAHINIFRTISALEANPMYDKDAIRELKKVYSTDAGLIMSEENIEQARARSERLQDMGLVDEENPMLGETVVNLTEHYVKVWDSKKEKFSIWLYVSVGDIKLATKRLEDVLNVNFFPFVSWSDDVEKTDIYPDGVGDIVRTPNKIVNSWFSQMTENRALRNFGMTFYDVTQDDSYTPQSYEASPWAWIPTPGDPNKTTKRVDIPDLSESLDEMNFVIGMVEKATASTATEKGVREEGEATLGQIKLMLSASNKRITSISKFYKIARRQFGDKWAALNEANAEHIKPVKLHKKSYKGNYFSTEVSPKDWKGEEGYSCRVVSSAERSQKGIEEVQKLQAISGMFPENKPLKKLLKQRALGIIDDLSQEEIDEVINYDESAEMAMAQQSQQAPIESPLSVPQMTQ